MTPASRTTFFLVIFAVVAVGKCQESHMEGREFNGYLPPEELKIPEYQVHGYPHQNYPFKDDYLECGKNPMIPFLGKALNLLLLKLGVFGIIKAVMALIFAAFLFKLPLLLLKFTFLKSFFFPFLIAPLLLHIYTSYMTQASDSASNQAKPGETPVEMPAMPAMPMMQGMQAMNEMTMGRQLNDNLTTIAWESMKMFAESDQCVERISCMIGASSKDSSIGFVFSRMLKYLHHSSPSSLRERMTLIREAYSKGSRTSTCLPEDYKCESPELMLQYGLKKIRIL